MISSPLNGAEIDLAQISKTGEVVIRSDKRQRIDRIACVNAEDRINSTADGVNSHGSRNRGRPGEPDRAPAYVGARRPRLSILTCRAGAVSVRGDRYTVQDPAVGEEVVGRLSFESARGEQGEQAEEQGTHQGFHYKYRQNSMVKGTEAN